MHLSGIRPHPGRAVCRFRQADFRPEGGAFTGAAFQVQRAAHQPDQLPADGQPQPGSRCLPLELLAQLHIGLINQRNIFRVNAHAGVFHGQPQAYLVAPPAQHFNADQHMAGIGKLDGVGQQVQHHLANTYRITHQRPGQVLIHPHFQCQAFLPGTAAEHVDEVVQGFPQVERNGFQFHLAGFHGGDVQQVVNDGREVFRRAQQGIHILPLFLVQRRVGQKVGVTEHGLQGDSQLVADVGQELVLGMVGADGFVAFVTGFQGVLAQGAGVFQNLQAHAVQGLLQF